jgi:hypothetical protein
MTAVDNPKPAVRQLILFHTVYCGFSFTKYLDADRLSIKE